MVSFYGRTAIELREENAMLMNAIRVSLAAVVAVGLPAMGEQQTEQPSRAAVIAAAKDIMNAAAVCALVTIGPDGAPQARMMDAFAPEDDLTVWMGTNRNTRKVAELRSDDRATLVYFDRDDPGYATLIGRVRIIDDPQEKRARWKDAWRDYYPGGPEGETYLLLQFVPERLEVVSVEHDIAAAPLAWKPAIVELARR
ncbi:MAG: pyridoxamine 5'-phosphate oxidase family protein [Acidobacteriota bacterium]|jgi:general stress protein 26